MFMATIYRETLTTLEEIIQERNVQKSCNGHFTENCADVKYAYEKKCSCYCCVHLKGMVCDTIGHLLGYRSYSRKGCVLTQGNWLA